MKDKSLRVLVVSPDFELIGGVVETVKLLLSELDGRIDVSTAILGRRQGQKGLAVYVQLLKDMFLLFKLLRRESFDVIHMNPSLNLRSYIKEYFFFYLFCSLGYSGRILLFFHGWDSSFFYNIKSNIISKTMFVRWLRRAGLVVVLASKFKHSLINLNVEASKIKVTSTMYEQNELSHFKRDILTRKSILFLSRIIPEKGVYELVESFAQFSVKHDGVNLIIAGDGPDRKALELTVKSKGLKNISFPGYVRGVEKRKLLEESCVFVLPTTHPEGCPVALLEAMAAGIVPIVSLVGGIQDIVVHDETAIVLDNVSVSAIVIALERLFNDLSLMKSISENAEKYAVSHFSSKKVCDNILGYYQQIKSNPH